MGGDNKTSIGKRYFQYAINNDNALMSLKSENNPVDLKQKG